MNKALFSFYFIASVILLEIVSFFIAVFSPLGFFESMRIVFGGVYVLFLPGFVLSFLFFGGRQIDWTERIALSFALSIAVVPLAVFYLNLIGVKINLLNSFLTVLVIIIVSAGILYWRRKSLLL